MLDLSRIGRFLSFAIDTAERHEPAQLSWPAWAACRRLATSCSDHQLKNAASQMRMTNEGRMELYERCAAACAAADTQHCCVRADESRRCWPASEGHRRGSVLKRLPRAMTICHPREEPLPYKSPRVGEPAPEAQLPCTILVNRSAFRKRSDSTRQPGRRAYAHRRPISNPINTPTPSAVAAVVQGRSCTYSSAIRAVLFPFSTTITCASVALFLT
ncbi:hypothetical protein SAMN03159335_07607 [Burkholderia cepacia]|nr:hypothetical protein SAMN03159335_07607 [Burkholderia cepacia]